MRWKCYILCLFLILTAFFFASGQWLKVELEKIDRRLSGVKPGVNLEGIWLAGNLEAEVISGVRYFSLQKQKLPIDATIDQSNGTVLPDQAGQAVNLHATISQVINADEDETVHWVYYSWPAKITADMLRDLAQIIGSYSTYVGGSNERQQNVKQAAEVINYDLVLPKEIYSFNAATGSKGPENGYQLAPILINGQIGYDYGGGVCQVSSTLYNAVLAAGLPVVERHAHSKEVIYVPEDRDATVSFGYLDFRFQNNLDLPILIRSRVYQSKLEIILLSGGK